MEFCEQLYQRHPDKRAHTNDLPKFVRHRSKEVGLGRGRFLGLLSMLTGLIEGFLLRRDHLEVLSCPHLTKCSARPHVVHLNWRPYLNGAEQECVRDADTDLLAQEREDRDDVTACERAAVLGRQVDNTMRLTSIAVNWEADNRRVRRDGRF
jgi:hypothetical protein